VEGVEVAGPWKLKPLEEDADELAKRKPPEDAGEPKKPPDAGDGVKLKPPWAGGLMLNPPCD
jgi:hypothetical protein